MCLFVCVCVSVCVVCACVCACVCVCVGVCVCVCLCVSIHSLPASPVLGFSIWFSVYMASIAWYVYRARELEFYPKEA